MRRRSLMVTLLALLGAAPVLAQARPAALQRYEAGGPSPRPLTPTWIPDSARHYPGTHWKTGLVLGGGLGLLAGGFLGVALCGISESEEDCLGPALGAALVLGTAGGTLGALVGGAFPKTESAVADSSRMRR